MNALQTPNRQTPTQPSSKRRSLRSSGQLRRRRTTSRGGAPPEAMTEWHDRSPKSEPPLFEERGADLEFDSNDLQIDGLDSGGLEIGGNELEIEENGNLQIQDPGNIGEIEIDASHIEQLLDIEEEDGRGVENNVHDDDDDYDDDDGGGGDDMGVDAGSDEVSIEGRDYPPPPPSVGMEFESYDDAYNYYINYAREVGFAIRVKSSWTKRNSKEKRGAVLCCNCEGFKLLKEANSRRKETRTGCQAMIRLRLVEFNRWRVDEVKLEHNHEFDQVRVQNSKSSKKKDAGSKRGPEPCVDVEVRTIKLYRAPAADSHGNGSISGEGESSHHLDKLKQLKLNKGDAEIIHNYFCQAQLRSPNFFYLMDLNDEGFLRNVFWIDSRSRAAYGYFCDAVVFDTTCLSNKFEIPLFAFVGVNHHGQPILLGCGLLVDEAFETYIWLFRAWLTCMLGRPPQTIITNECKAMQSAISVVFPRAHHRHFSSPVVQRILENFTAHPEYEELETVLHGAVYESQKVDDFEMAWEHMIQHFKLTYTSQGWLQTLFDDRERWVPVYSKDTFLAGIPTFEEGQSLTSFFEGYLHQQTSLKEFFEIYDIVQRRKCQKEAADDFDSKDLGAMLRTSFSYEPQLSKMYTRDIFMKFQEEILRMSSLRITEDVAKGSVIAYTVKERDCDESAAEFRCFEVMYDKSGPEVRCVCGCFNFKGFLCRHALCILNYNGVEELPCQYILARWRKDFKRLYVPDCGPNNVDITNPVQCFDHLYRRAMLVVEEGLISHDHYMVAWQAFKESLNKVRLAADKELQL